MHPIGAQAAVAAHAHPAPAGHEHDRTPPHKSHGGTSKFLKDRCLVAALIITAISAIYWTMFASNAYSTFHEYDDLGIFAHNMWLDINYPGISSGLQYLVFGNHISPDLVLLVLPFFAIAQSSLTLLVIQVLFSSAAAISVFFISRDLLKSNGLAMLFFIAFLVNPGVNGMLVFDFHIESLITIFYLLAFYFYIKLRKRLFILSSILLLATFEEAPYLGATLAIGLLVYEFLYNRKGSEGASPQRIRLAAMLLGLSILFFVVYQGITIFLLQSYSSGSYSSLPPYLKVGPGVFLSLFIYHGATASAGAPLTYTLYALAVGILFVGGAALIDPIVTLVLASAYLGELFVVGNSGFVYVFQQYFSFIIGPVIVAGVLGIMLLQARKGYLGRMLAKWEESGKKPIPYVLIIASSLAIANILILWAYPSFVLSRNTNNLAQDFLFQVSPAQHAYYQQLYSVMALIPNNASLTAPFFTTPHLMNRLYLQDTGYTMPIWYFKPEYILIDVNLNVSLNAYAGIDQLRQYLNQTSNYTIYARNGSAILLRYAGP